MIYGGDSMTKEEIFKKDFYDFTVFSYRQGQFVTVAVDADGVYDMYKAWTKLGSLKHEFPIFWDFVHALLSYKM